MSGAEWVVLSEANGTAKLRSFCDSVPAATVVIVAGAGSGSTRPTVEVGDADATGINRRETYVDASDCADNDSMTARGNEVLAESTITSVEVELTRPGMYGSDFFLGDTVSVDMGMYGAYALPVSEVDTELTAEGRTISVTLGAPEKGIMRVIRDSITATPSRRN